ncbi:hypothetical protein [Deinococcus yavapaiensis]|uniref:Uncharacterized protein n=1 Tax=Deinococcus yavapaiensis KR-236 TaxID=694435 RepID=A0A318S3U6_9DEIO|nr:hypothetical protein [Deinococcus yavapaiensis]PYE52730.1 hypothetical protein DES52_11251 [Deinococcus yavapaiensis KR-236]
MNATQPSSRARAADALSIDVTLTPHTYPHVLHTSRPLGLREDRKEAYHALLRDIVEGQADSDDVRTWLRRAAKERTLARLPGAREGGHFVFPLLLYVRDAPHVAVHPDDLRLVT